MLLLSAVAPARGQAIAPPAVGQPTDFSNVVGVFTLAAEATPTSVAVEEPVELLVTITGQAVAPHVPQRAHLKLFPAGVERQFFIEPLAEQAGPGEWRFRYRLRPKSVDVRHIPGLALVYYAPRGRRYQTAYSDAIPIQVKPRAETAIEVKGLQVVSAPASFRTLAPLPTGSRASAWATSLLSLSAALVLPLLAAGAGAWLWRRTHPAAHEQQRRRQGRAAQATVAALASAQTVPEATARLADYLRVRWDYPGAEPTPRDVDRWLRRRGVRPPARQRWRTFLAACDAVRYVPGPATANGWSSAEAAELIHALEAEPCAHSQR